jgi:phage terminase large subunit-like protein
MSLPRLDKWADHDQIAAFIAAVNPHWHADEDVTLEFSRCSFLSAEGAALLAAFKLHRSRFGSTGDFTALAMLFPHDDEEVIEIEDGEQGKEAKRVLLRRSYTMLARFWPPEHPARRRDYATEQKIDLWRKLGLVKTTPGDQVDYDVVVDDVVRLGDLYAVREVAIDREFQAHHTAQLLLKHFGDKRVVACQNNALWMNAPFRELLELIRARRIGHDGNPVVRWMLANAVARARNGLIMPDKGASADKIDILSAAVTGLGRTIIQPPKPVNSYESGGLFAV